MSRLVALACILALGFASVAYATTRRSLTASESGGNLSFSKSHLTASPGRVKLKLRVPSSLKLTHDISIRGHGVHKTGRIVSGGGTSRVRARLKKGTYTFFCSVGDHESEGMRGTLTVK
jgi:plastocyanin